MNTDKTLFKRPIAAAVAALDAYFNSIFFPLVTAAVILCCYYMGWDMFSIWYISISGTLILLTCKNVLPLISLLLFLNIFISRINTPAPMNGHEPSDYYMRTEVLAAIIVAISIFVVTAILRTVYAAKHGAVKPDGMFIGIAIFAVALTVNGLFAAEYDAMNLLFGFLLGLTFVVAYLIAAGGIKIERDSFVKVALYFVLFSAVLVVELIVAYLTYDNLIVDGEVIKGNLRFGWGTHNNMGMFLNICIPAAYYLAIKLKYGAPFSLYGILLLAASFLTMSRQSMLGGTIATFACIIWHLIGTNGGERATFAIIYSCLFCAIFITFGTMNEPLSKFFASFNTALDSGSGRTEIWDDGIKNFLAFPLFGSGFFAETLESANLQDGINFLPPMYHDTIVQILASCGLFGIAAYAVHRIQTIISYFKNITRERTLIALMLATFLIVCLLDNYIFYIMPTFTYVFLVVLLKKSEGGKEENAQKRCNFIVKN